MQPNLRMLLLLASASGAAAVHSVQAGALASPVEQVVSLLTSMQADVEADAKADSEAYKEYECWCKTNKQDHTYQVENQSEHIETLSSNIELLSGRKATLESKISSGLQAINASKKSLMRATAVREKEATAHQAEAADMSETIDLLGKAIKLLSTVQLTQLPGQSLRAAPSPSLVSDLHAAIHAIHGKADKYHDVMQMDLWKMIGSFDKALGGSGPGALNQQSLEALAGPVSAIPGASDYTSRSNSVYGVLTQMKSDFEEDLKEAEAEESSAQASFETLSEAILEEIKASKEAVDADKVELTDTRMKLVEANHDLEVTQGALAKDQQFLVDLTKACTSSAEAYAERTAVRDEEIRALGEARNMLMTDDARDLFATSFSFIQAGQQHTSGASDSSAAHAAVQNTLMVNAMRQILHSASRHKNWALAGLAVRMRLDSFTKVKEMMDKMLSDLKDQRKAETDKRDTCMKQIDETEDDITEKKNDKADLEVTEFGITNDIATLSEEIDALNTSVSQVQLALKKGSEERKTENAVFQKAVMDQRNTINILEMTVKRLKMFYTPKSFVQVQQGTAKGDPPAVKSYTVHYKKHNTIGGVFELLRMIITDATKMDTELSVDEQHAQQSYEMFVNDCMATVQADSEAINMLTILRSEATAALDSTKESIETAAGELDSLAKLLSDYHADCDWLLKYYKTRQTALAEEIEAVAEAKAILSGAKFS